MSETLLIHYNINHRLHATWALCNDNGELTSKITTGSLDELTELAETYPVVVLLNSQCLHINKLDLPTSNTQKMLKAVPFAVEEYIASDIEDFHFVIAKNKHDGTASVVGIDRNTLRGIISDFQQVDITVEKIIPDALCLAADIEVGQWACLNFNDDYYLQTEPQYGLTMSDDIFSYVLEQRLGREKNSLPDKILFFSEQENPSVFEPINLDEMSEDDNDAKADDTRSDETNQADNNQTDSRHGNIEKINIVYNSHPLVIFCGNFRKAMPLNLLQHEFKTKRKSSGLWQYWRLAASLAAIWLILNLGFTMFQSSRLAEENKITQAKIEKIYRSAFPKSRKIVNPRVQMEQKLKALKSSSGGSNSGLIFLLAESFGTQVPDKQNISLQSLAFRNNRMDIGLDSSNLQAIESLNQNLNKNSQIRSEIISSTSEKNKVKGNIRIQGRS